MNTYLKCLRPEIKEYLNINHNSIITCDYISFLQHVRIDIMNLCILSWIEYNRKPINNDIIFKAICEHILLKSNNLKAIYIYGELKFNIFKLPNANKSLSSIKSFKCCFDFTQSEYFEDILYFATKISKFIEHIKISSIDERPTPFLNIRMNRLSSYKNFVDFLKNQQNLKKLSFNYLDFSFVDNILKNGHLSSITKLTLRGINNKLESHPLILNELALFVNLTQLKLHECSNFYFSEKTFLEKSNQLLSKLSKISFQNNQNISQEFLNIIIKRSGKSIMELYMYDAIDLTNFSAILNCCNNLIRFSCLINNKNLYVIMDIINNSTNLKYLRIGFYDNISNIILPLNTLSDIAKNVPISLQSLRLSIFLRNDLFLTRETLVEFLQILSKRQKKLKYLKIASWNLLINNNNLIYKIITSSCDINEIGVIKIGNKSFNNIGK